MPDLPGSDRKIKRFRVAREGQTVDGRNLSAQDIQEMAATYNPDEYGARINVEHISGFSPQPPFNAYGDVILVDAAQENGLWCLYNTISALPNFVAMSALGQKIYPSIEFIRDFAGTGKAYQVGLGMTDNPASRGTEAIKFNSSQFGKTPVLRTEPNTEIFYMTTQQQNQNTPAPQQSNDLGLLEKIKTLLSGNAPQQAPAPTPAAAPTQPEMLTSIADALVLMAGNMGTINHNHAQLQQTLTQLKQQNTTLGASTPATQTDALHTESLTQINQPSNTQTQQFQTQQPAPTSLDERFTKMESQFSQLIETLSKTPANAAAPVVTGGDSNQNDF